ncbi:MAG TPA: metalloregulator ArsR/SmtB family transcription factor [Kiritimatiellia bacterium]|nr:metalloregulator ArsR/SmtB family transcription factor [Kiritimatiellia bacterium]
MRATVKLFRALSDPTRLRLLFALRDGECCVCQLIALVDLAPSTVSKHLSLLREAGLIESRKQGRWVHYRLADPLPFPMFGTSSPGSFQTLENDPVLRADARNLVRIRALDLVELCPSTPRKISRP